MFFKICRAVWLEIAAALGWIAMALALSWYGYVAFGAMLWYRGSHRSDLAILMGAEVLVTLALIVVLVVVLVKAIPLTKKEVGYRLSE